MIKPPFKRRRTIFDAPSVPPKQNGLRATLAELKKAPLHYINPKAVETYLGKYAPLGANLFAKILEEVLQGLNEGYVYWSGKRRRAKSNPPEISAALVGVSDQLLQDNLLRSGRDAWSFFSDIDFDIVHTATQAEGVVTEIKPYYFFYTEFARPRTERRVVLHIVHNTFQGTQWSISIPLQMLMRGFPTIPDSHIGYAHGIMLVDADGKPADKEYHYVGISKRNWLQRMGEHFNEVRTGSNRTFHRAWREYAGRHDVRLSSELIVGNHSFEQIMNWEEWAVDREMAKGTSLNMIPGGFKGIKFLHEHRLLNPVAKLTIEDRDKAIATFQRQHPRLGIPNLLVSALWKNEDYALRVICGPEGRLSPEQVRQIRSLHETGLPVEQISEMIGARNVAQVARVVAGETYARIH